MCDKGSMERTRRGRPAGDVSAKRLECGCRAQVQATGWRQFATQTGVW